MKMLLNGKKVGTEGREEIIVINPYTHEEIDRVPCADLNDIDTALECAREGAEKWGRVPVLERVRILEKVSSKIAEKKKDIALLLSKEAGKIYTQAEEEVDHAIGLFKEYANRLRYDYDSVLPSNEDMILVTREPLGVVACILPFNFPVELYAQKVAPALAAGNAIIIKPSVETPLSSIYLSELIIECGVEPKALQVITGHGSVVGSALASSDKIDAVSMTGSTEAGISIYVSAAKNLSRCFLELGGNDPLIIFDDVDLDTAVTEAINGRIVHAGQACCSSKRFIVQENIYDEFAGRLAERLKGMKIGDPLDQGSRIGPLIDERAAQRVEEIVDRTVKAGAYCLCGGRRFDGNFFEPTVLTGVTPAMDIAQNLEVFGPVFPLIKFKTEEQAVAIADRILMTYPTGKSVQDIMHITGLPLYLAEKVFDKCEWKYNYKRNFPKGYAIGQVTVVRNMVKNEHVDAKKLESFLNMDSAKAEQWEKNPDKAAITELLSHHLDIYQIMDALSMTIEKVQELIPDYQELQPYQPVFKPVSVTDEEAEKAYQEHISD